MTTVEETLREYEEAIQALSIRLVELEDLRKTCRINSRDWHDLNKRMSVLEYNRWHMEASARDLREYRECAVRNHSTKRRLL